MGPPSPCLGKAWQQLRSECTRKLRQEGKDSIQREHCGNPLTAYDATTAIFVRNWVKPCSVVWCLRRFGKVLNLLLQN